VDYDAVSRRSTTIVEGTCPIIGNFGARMLRGAAGRLERALVRPSYDPPSNIIQTPAIHF
jgi:hypothetical protein